MYHEQPDDEKPGFWGEITALFQHCTVLYWGKLYQLTEAIFEQVIVKHNTHHRPIKDK
ncbi:hypothetical protein GCM10022421_26040 [Oceanisphaera sediminis]|uniref:Uncharacterized protein n=1 Tax=Oceanisphaera sediminis TaxID=981381 RepID=A0ABP7EDD4_9GAMM